MKCFLFSCKLAFRIALVFLIGFAAATSARADNLYARIHGTITDSSGAVVPGVTVIAFNTGTGHFAHGHLGRQRQLRIHPASHRNLSSQRQQERLQEAESMGSRSCSTRTTRFRSRWKSARRPKPSNVEANPVQVETTSNQLGAVVSGKTIVDMPLLARNWIQLQQLQTGVVGTSDRFGDTFATNGSQAQQNSYLIDGIDDNDITLNDRLLIPSPDAIAEFNMVTNTLNAEYGRNSGAILERGHQVGNELISWRPV